MWDNDRWDTSKRTNVCRTRNHRSHRAIERSTISSWASACVQRPSDLTVAELYADAEANTLRRNKKRHRNAGTQPLLPGIKLLNTFKRPGRLISPKLLPSSMMQRITSESSCFFLSTETLFAIGRFRVEQTANCWSWWTWRRCFRRPVVPQFFRLKIAAQRLHRALSSASCFIFRIFLHVLPHTGMTIARLPWLVRNRIFLIFWTIWRSLLRWIVDALVRCLFNRSRQQSRRWLRCLRWGDITITSIETSCVSSSIRHSFGRHCFLWLRTIVEIIRVVFKTSGIKLFSVRVFSFAIDGSIHGMLPPSFYVVNYGARMISFLKYQVAIGSTEKDSIPTWASIFMPMNSYCFAFN